MQREDGGLQRRLAAIQTAIDVAEAGGQAEPPGSSGRLRLVAGGSSSRTSRSSGGGEGELMVMGGEQPLHSGRLLLLPANRRTSSIGGRWAGSRGSDGGEGAGGPDGGGSEDWGEGLVGGGGWG
jgi:hypothetical protein